LATGQTDYRYLQVAVLALMVAIGWLNGLGWEYYWSCLWPGAVCLAAEADFKRERDACFKAFMNNYVGLVLFLGLAMSYLHKKAAIWLLFYYHPLPVGEGRGEGIRPLFTLVLRRALNRQTHIRRNQIGQHLVNLQRLFRLGIAGIADIAFITQRQHQRAEYRFVEELRRVNAVQHRQALRQRAALFLQRAAVDGRVRAQQPEGNGVALQRFARACRQQLQGTGARRIDMQLVVITVISP
jgi:hypothetical protein